MAAVSGSATASVGRSGSCSEPRPCVAHCLPSWPRSFSSVSRPPAAPRPSMPSSSTTPDSITTSSRRAPTRSPSSTRACSSAGSARSSASRCSNRPMRRRARLPCAGSTAIRWPVSTPILLGVRGRVCGGRAEISARVAARVEQRLSRVPSRHGLRPMPGEFRRGLPQLEQPSRFEPPLHDRYRRARRDDRQRLRGGGLWPRPPAGRDVRAPAAGLRGPGVHALPQQQQRGGRCLGLAQRALCRQPDELRVDQLHEHRPAVHGVQSERGWCHLFGGRVERGRRRRAREHDRDLDHAAAAPAAGEPSGVQPGRHQPEPVAGGRIAARRAELLHEQPDEPTSGPVA